MSRDSDVRFKCVEKFTLQQAEGVKNISAAVMRKETQKT